MDEKDLVLGWILFGCFIVALIYIFAPPWWFDD